MQRLIREVGGRQLGSITKQMDSKWEVYSYIIPTRLATKRKIVRQIPLVGSSNDSATTTVDINN